jgi:hypothetical protein
MMKSNLEVDNISAGPGEKAKGFVVVDTTASGTQVRVPVILINGAKEGPTLLVTSGVHGDDLNTIPMVWRIAENVDPAELSGQLIAIPICNPPAFEAGSHLSPGDNKSLSFPGNAQGSISERMGYHLYHKIVVQADYLLDMHGGSVRSTLAALVVVDHGADEETVEAANAMAEAFNPDLIIEGKSKGGQPPTAMFQITSRNGNPGLLIGMGKMGFNESDTVRGARGVLNVMRHLNMMEGELEIVATPRHTAAEVYHHTPFGGGFFPAVDVGDEVKAGDTLGTVFNAFGEPNGDVKADVSGMVDAIRFYPVVGAGDWVASIAEI